MEINDTFRDMMNGEYNTEIVKTVEGHRRAKKSDEADLEVGGIELTDDNLDIKKISQWKFGEEAILYLDEPSFLSLLEDLKTSPYRHKLPEQIIRVILIRAFNHTEATGKMTGDIMEVGKSLEQMDGAIALHNDFNPQEDADGSLIEKTALIVQDLAKKYPISSIALWQKITDHQAGTIRPEKYFELITDQYLDPDIPETMKRDSMESLMYLVNDNNEYKDRIIERLKNDTDSFKKIFKIICFLKHVRAIAEKYNWSAGTVESITEIFKETESFIESGHNNFLLKKYLEYLIEGKFEEQVYEDRLAFEGNDGEEEPKMYRVKNESLGENFSFVHRADKNGRSIAWGINERYGENDLPQSLDFIYGTAKLSPDYEAAYDLVSGDLIMLVDKRTGQLMDLDDKLLANHDYNNKNIQRKENIKEKIADFRVLTDGFFRKIINEYFEINLDNFNLEVQMWFLDFIKNGDDKKFAQVKGFIQKHGEAGIKTFLAMEHGDDKGEMILDISESKYGSEVIGAFNELVRKGQDETTITIEQLKQLSPELTTDSDKILSIMIARGKDLLVEVHKLLDGGQQEKITSLIAEIRKETTTQSVLREKFVAVASLLEQDNIDLSRYNEANLLSLKGLEKPENKAVFLKALNAMDKLAPVPEIHWRVDRTMTEYSRRVGLNLDNLLKAKSDSAGGRKLNLVEIGPGNGTNKKEREAELGGRFNDFTLSDKIYYPLAGAFYKLIDFKKINETLGVEFSEQEKQLLAEYLYKVAVIKEGQTAQDNFEYDEDFGVNVAEDINNLKGEIDNLGTKIKNADTVPSTISIHNDAGQVVYPYKLELTDNIKRAVELMKVNLPEFLIDDHQKKDYYELIDAFPASVIVGDMRDISRFNDDQIDVEIGVRSTVYCRGENYVNFLKNLLAKLSEGGMTIDDSVRDNDGYYYRLAEIQKALKESGLEVEALVVMGPGFPGEDLRQDKVPLSIILTKKGSSRDLVLANLQDNCEIINLNDLANQNDYLRTLDKNGATADRLKLAA